MNPRAIRPTMRARTGQRGSVLIIAIVLLLLAGVMTLLALNVGAFEQRTTSNDLRAKMVRELGEAGVAQGAEFLFRQHPDWLADTGRWEACGTADTTFPCGAVEQFEPDGVTPRRANFYRLEAQANAIADIPSEMSQYMLPMGNKIATVGNGEQAAYGVAPLTCFTERPDAADPPETPIRCGDGASALSTDLRIVTFVSVARLPNENARVTLVNTVGSYPLLGDLSGQPPLTASGSADITGGLQIVTNPNAGGAGVPVSVWTRRDIQKTGTPNTCYADEFYRYTKNNVTPTLVAGTSSIRCDTCQCDVNGAPNTLSYDNSGNLQDEGIDILDVEGNSTQRGTGTNHNVRADSLSHPICEFPPDLFQLSFRINAWSDTDGDCFAETKVMTQYRNPNSGALVTMGADEAWLYEHADKIIPANDAAHTYAGVQSSTLLKPGQLGTSALLSSTASSGIIWCQANCDIGANTEVGSAAAPVILILDGPDVTIQGVVWGFVFIRSTDNNPASPAVANAATGGTASLRMNAGAVVYGALVIQGQVEKANGTAAIVYDGNVLATLEDSLGSEFATLPGAWNDQRTY